MTVAIPAHLVKELREITGAAIMDCKKALVDAQGDMQAAIEAMRISGQAKAVKKANRIAAEGIIVIRSEGKSGAMLEVNCETDFVARDSSFLEFSSQVAGAALQHRVDTVENLLETKLASGETVETTRQALVTKIGENIQIRRIVFMQVDDALGTYLHGSKIGVLLNLSGGDESLAKDLAMHVAAMKPAVVLPEQVPQSLVELERKVQIEQAIESGKSQELIDKMIDGRMRKFLNEVSLVGQSFVKDPAITVADLLKKHSAKVISFVRFEAGEGIEKKVDNFAEEVMAQVKGS